MWHGFDIYGLICLRQSVLLTRRTLRASPYTTMGTVCSSTLLGGLVDLNVLDDQVSGVETLGVGVCLSVLKETEEKLGGLDWPSCAGDTELLA